MSRGALSNGAIPPSGTPNAPLCWLRSRIRISVDAHGEVAEAIEEHSLYICTETLAVELRCGAPPKDSMAREVDLEAARVKVAVARA